jgi:hypothetical protein
LAGGRVGRRRRAAPARLGRAGCRRARRAASRRARRPASRWARRAASRRARRPASRVRRRAAASRPARRAGRPVRRLPAGAAARRAEVETARRGRRGDALGPAGTRAPAGAALGGAPGAVEVDHCRHDDAVERRDARGRHLGRTAAAQGPSPQVRGRCGCRSSADESRSQRCGRSLFAADHRLDARTIGTVAFYHARGMSTPPSRQPVVQAGSTRSLPAAFAR